MVNFANYVDPGEYGYYDEKNNRVYKVVGRNYVSKAKTIYKARWHDLATRDHGSREWKAAREVASTEDKAKAELDLARLAMRKGWISTAKYELMHRGEKS